MPRLLLALLLFGILPSDAGDVSLIRIGEYWRYQKGVAEAPFPGWTQPGFSDDGWLIGPSGFSGTTFPEATVIPDYGSNFRTVYFRKEFDVPQVEQIRWLIFRVDYQHGLVVYVNGQEVARRGVPGEVGERVGVDELAVVTRGRWATEEIDLSHGIPLLREGANTLAVQLVGGTNSLQAAFAPELLANFNRGPFLQSTSTNSTLVVWKTPFAADGFVDVGISEGEPVRVAGSFGTSHVVALTNLQPDTVYQYRVGALTEGQEVLSDWADFRTFKTAGPVSFTLLGDSGAANVAQYAIAERMREAGGDLIMHVGDMIYDAFRHTTADLRCLSVYGEQMRSIPMFVAMGNHEFYYDQTAAFETFYLPTNQVTGTEHYYSFDHGDVHFTVLWTELPMGADYEVGSAQYQWLTNDLATTTKRWKFLFFHHTLRSSGYHQIDDYDLDGVLDEIQLEQSIGRAASEHGVDIIFNGHDHDYEMCAPVDGPVTFVSGGGGAVPYYLSKVKPTSVHFEARHHFLKVHAEGEVVRVEAIGPAGELIDVRHLTRALPEKKIYTAEWHSPVIESGPANDGDGNVLNQRFDFMGSPVPGSLGKFSAPGRLFVNHDGTNLYFGFNEVMLQPGQELLLLLELPGIAGMSSMRGVGNGLSDPFGEGADGLDYLENLAFTNFAPGIGVILGDEYGDGPSRYLKRAGLEIPTGQGAYFLREGLPMVAGQRLQQYNRSPQVAPFYGEGNANFIELALPMSALAAFDPEESLKVAALVLTTNLNLETQSRVIDTGAIAALLEQAGDSVLLEGLEVALAPDTDFDSDGLSQPVEMVLGTNPQDEDSDQDGLTDGWEVRHGMDPLGAEGMDGWSGDPDGDEFLNGQEFRAGTDPRDASSLLRVSIERGPEMITIRWETVPGRSYQIELKNRLDGAFGPIDLENPVRQAGGTSEQYVLPIPDGGSEPLYFRVLVVP